MFVLYVTFNMCSGLLDTKGIADCAADLFRHPLVRISYHVCQPFEAVHTSTTT